MGTTYYVLAEVLQCTRTSSLSVLPNTGLYKLRLIATETLKFKLTYNFPQQRCNKIKALLSEWNEGTLHEQLIWASE